MIEMNHKPGEHVDLDMRAKPYVQKSMARKDTHYDSGQSCEAVVPCIHVNIHRFQPTC